MPSQTRRDRLAILLRAVDPDQVPASGASSIVNQLEPVFARAGRDLVWLALCVLRAEFPTATEVVETARSIVLEGPGVVLERLSRRAVHAGIAGGFAVRPVRVVEGAVVVDVHHTARTGLATGIQRVVRKTIAVWDQAHPIMLVGWGSTFGALRELAPFERENALHGSMPHTAHPRSGEVTIPWRSTYILPELAIEPERVARISALAEFSGNGTFAIGFDCVPLTSAETTALGMGGAFAKNLAALARFDRIATISAAAETEYRGWKRMLSGAGLEGPEVQEVFLATDVLDVDQAGLNAARGDLVLDGLPLLLCVGSHEPRKNHLAVLNAAELLWREGRSFCLSFVGGNSWNGNAFMDELRQLRDRGRPVQTLSAISDDLLWGGYRVARATVFPSLNEGFGLPVAESLVAGTPVITSAFGSMQEIASGGGAILVDPRDDRALAEAIDVAMFDEETNARLRREASSVVPKSWEQYASELWEFFHATPSAAIGGQTAQIRS